MQIKNITKIDEGNCLVHTADLQIKRKVYGYKEGKTLVYFKSKAYCFDGYDDLGTANNIQLLGAYKGYWKEDGIEFKSFKTTISHDIKKEVQVPSPVVIKSGEANHKEYETILTCVRANIPVYLYGPAGSGKNHALQQIATELGLDFYLTNSVQQEFKITGFIDAGGKYHETEFYRAFTKGGLFFLDEMDASIPEVLVLLNAAIANGYFEFPNGKADAHKDFRAVAAGNTVGNGADEQYTGRLQLDQSTLDRFVAIEFDYDENVENKLANNNKELLEFVRYLRKQAKEKGIRTTFSYRCIMMVVELEDKIDLVKILKIAVFKGLDKDTVNTFDPNGFHNKYFNAMREVQRAA